MDVNEELNFCENSKNNLFIFLEGSPGGWSSWLGSGWM